MCYLNETEMESHHYLAHTVCSFTLSVVGTVGNASSVYVILRGRLHATSATMALLINLCLADLTIATLLLPLLGFNGLHEHWLYGDTFCQAFAYLLYVTLSSEFLILIVITLNQYLTVVRTVPVSLNRHRHDRHHRAKLVSASLSPWLFSAALYLLPLTGHWGRFAFDPRVHMCTLVSQTGGILGMKSFMAAFTLLVSLTVITYCYTAIYCLHHRSQRKTNPSSSSSFSTSDRQRRQHQMTTPDNATDSTGVRGSTSGNSNSNSTSGNSRNTKLIRMITVILVNFGATYLPFLLMYATDPCLSRTPSSAVLAIIFLSLSHSATNPIIYALMNKQILSQWKQLLSGCLAWPKCPSWSSSCCPRGCCCCSSSSCSHKNQTAGEMTKEGV